MTGTVGILNVGAGDIALSFNSDDPAEVIRAGRIVKDMLRRGFALLVEVDRNGEKKFERALNFNEKTNRYIIADVAPLEAQPESLILYDASGRVLRKENVEQHGEIIESAEASPAETSTGQDTAEGADKPKRRGRSKTREVDAADTRAVAVGRSAGG